MISYQKQFRAGFACLLIVAILAGIAGAARAELQPPVPYTAGEMIKGIRESKKYNLDEILVYKKLPQYSQPAWMDELVTKAMMLPVEERLPEEPQVLLKSGMSSGLGEYGGVWRDFSGDIIQGWNLQAGQSPGWFGIGYIFEESLVSTGPMFMVKNTTEPLPNLAKSWEWSEDGMELTMHLIKGAKWSDGQPFTSRDVMFTWEDMILDPNVKSWTSRSTWQIDGKDVQLEALDTYTIKWIFPEPYPVYMLFNMDWLDFSVSPAHVLKRQHPKYNPDADYFSFENCLPPEQLPAVTMGPWVPVRYETDQLLIMRRNPYYWKVDENGKQLPYLDEVTFEKGTSGAGRTLGTMNGSLDHANLENPDLFGEVLKAAAKPDAHFYIEWGPELLSFPLILNLSANLGVQSERDAVLRHLFRDTRFRRALSYAIDRDAIAKTVVKGPFLRPFPGGIFPGSLYFDPASVVYYSYHPDSAKELLAELGLKDTDDDGILNWTDGPLQGKNLEIELLAHSDQLTGGHIAELLAEQLAEVGLRINTRVETGAHVEARFRSGQFEMAVSRSTSEYAVPFAKYNEIAPLTHEAPDWHRAGAEPRKLLPFEEELIRIAKQFAVEPGSEKRKALMREYNTIFTENCYVIGTVIGRYGLALAKRFQNVPVGTPPFFYQWTWDNVRPEQIWVKPDEQLQQMMPEALPAYK